MISKGKHSQDIQENIMLSNHNSKKSNSNSRSSSSSSIDLEETNKGILPNKIGLIQMNTNNVPTASMIYNPVKKIELGKSSSPKNESLGFYKQNFIDDKSTPKIILSPSMHGIGYEMYSGEERKDIIHDSSSNCGTDTFLYINPTKSHGKFYKNSFQDPLPVAQFTGVPQNFINSLYISSNQMSSSNLVLLNPNTGRNENKEHRTSPSPIKIEDFSIPKSSNESGVSGQGLDGQDNFIEARSRIKSDDSQDSILPSSAITPGFNLDQNDEEKKFSISSSISKTIDENESRSKLKCPISIESSYSIRIVQDNYSESPFMCSAEALTYEQIIRQLLSQPYKKKKLWSNPPFFKKLMCCFTTPENIPYTDFQEQNAFFLMELGLTNFNNRIELHRNIFMSYYVRYCKNPIFENTESMWSQLGFSCIEYDKNELTKNGIILSILHFIYMDTKYNQNATKFIELVRMQALEFFLPIEHKLIEHSIVNLKNKKLNRILFKSEHVFDNFFEYQTRILNAWSQSFEIQKDLIQANNDAINLAEEEIKVVPL
ncbi:hypothetical protein SteCoe_15268 [Stentor coeruleus]|uniref:ELMO domain-containing protein n=1 Tax=Stentor coeruleus TaxID=5963 RepID=A0A1R2C3Z2_9CILI|nr:hypothetical protein SteCoe_15268 [Stentor coeruleus]